MQWNNCGIIGRGSVAYQGSVMGGPKWGMQIQNGGRPLSWKYKNRCIPAVSGPICTKFG